MWLMFLKIFNGVAFFPEREWEDSSLLECFTDSARAYRLGCGAYFQGHLVFLLWPMHWNAQEIMKDITFVELIRIMVAIEVWGTKLYMEKVMFYVENLFTGQCY